jgi:hypothetical protein
MFIPSDRAIEAGCVRFVCRSTEAGVQHRRRMGVCPDLASILFVAYLVEIGMFVPGRDQELGRSIGRKDE